MWTIPANVAAKTGRELRVPLSARAIEIIEEMKAIGLSDRYVFPGSRVGQPISEGSMLDVVRTIDPVATVHGMRACLKTWATEQTGFPREVIEMALGHQVGDATERAYTRGDMFARRVALAGSMGCRLRRGRTGQRRQAGRLTGVRPPFGVNDRTWSSLPGLDAAWSALHTFGRVLCWARPFSFSATGELKMAWLL